MQEVKDGEWGNQLVWLLNNTIIQDIWLGSVIPNRILWYLQSLLFV